jgi:hypothetical protein
MRLAALVLLCTTACSAAPLDLGFGVAVTATFDSTVSDATLATVTQIAISASGDETYMADEQLMRAAHRTEGFVYRPLLDTRHLTLTLTAEDADGAAVAKGSSPEIELVAGKTAQLEITLFAGGTSPMDGGALDSAGDGAGPTFPTCAGLGYALCEDFEQAISAAWTTSDTNGTVTTDTSHAHSGTHSMHVHLDSVAPGASAQAWLTEMQTVTNPSTDFHARAFVLFPSAVPTGLFPIMSVQQTSSPFDLMEVELSNGLVAMYDGFGTTTPYAQSASMFPTEAWTCAEWYVHFGSPGSLTVSINGTLLSDAEVEDLTYSSPPVGWLLFGGSQGGSDVTSMLPAYDFWMDDLVVDPKPIGCSE